MKNINKNTKKNLKKNKNKSYRGGEINARCGPALNKGRLGGLERDEMPCGQNEVCQDATNPVITYNTNVPLTPYARWGDNDVKKEAMGTCQVPQVLCGPQLIKGPIPGGLDRAQEDCPVDSDSGEQMACYDEKGNEIDTSKYIKTSTRWLANDIKENARGTCKLKIPDGDEGGICRSTFLNRDGTSLGDDWSNGIPCKDPKTECLRKDGSVVNEEEKAGRLSSWKESDVDKYKGRCQNPDGNKTTFMQRNTPGMVYRTGNYAANAAVSGTRATANAVIGKSASRIADVKAMADCIPAKNMISASDSWWGKTGGRDLIFTKNLWRNIKRNMLILASTDTQILEKMLLQNPDDQNDFTNLLTVAKNTSKISGKKLQINPISYKNTGGESSGYGGKNKRKQRKLTKNKKKNNKKKSNKK